MAEGKEWRNICRPSHSHYIWNRSLGSRRGFHPFRQVSGASFCHFLSFRSKDFCWYLCFAHSKATSRKIPTAHILSSSSEAAMNYLFSSSPALSIASRCSLGSNSLKWIMIQMIVNIAHLFAFDGAGLAVGAYKNGYDGWRFGAIVTPTMRGEKAIKRRLIAHKFEAFEGKQKGREKVLVNRSDHLSSAWGFFIVILRQWFEFHDS